MIEFALGRSNRAARMGIPKVGILLPETHPHQYPAGVDQEEGLLVLDSSQQIALFTGPGGAWFLGS